VNLVPAVPALAGGITLLRGLHAPAAREPGRHADAAGAVLSFAGLFSVVFGFSRAETSGWGDAGAIAEVPG
jgi:hypothetical protein